MLTTLTPASATGAALPASGLSDATTATPLPGNAMMPASAFSAVELGFLSTTTPTTTAMTATTATMPPMITPAPPPGFVGALIGVGYAWPLPVGTGACCGIPGLDG